MIGASPLALLPPPSCNRLMETVRECVHAGVTQRSSNHSAASSHRLTCLFLTLEIDRHILEQPDITWRWRLPRPKAADCGGDFLSDLLPLALLSRCLTAKCDYFPLFKSLCQFPNSLAPPWCEVWRRGEAGPNSQSSNCS